MSAIQQKEMLLDMEPILEHNYNLFNNPEFIKSEWKHLTDSLADIVKFYEYKLPYRLDFKTMQAIPLDPNECGSTNVREQNIEVY